MERQVFDNVWDALEETPADAENMTTRSNLLIAIEREVRGWRVTRSEAADRLGIAQPRLNDLLKGKIANSSLDALIKLANAAGLIVKLEIARAA